MIVNNKTIYTLELLNLNNIARGSCIPEGLYLVNQRWSEKHKEHYHILNVENRDLILIHVANYVTQLLGCIGVGFVKSDLNKDGIKDITESRKALDFILKELGKEFILEIKN